LQGIIQTWIPHTEEKQKKEEINVIETVKGGNYCGKINSLSLFSLKMGSYNIF
jgi:hypothetical protein